MEHTEIAAMSIGCATVPPTWTPEADTTKVFAVFAADNKYINFTRDVGELHGTEAIDVVKPVVRPGISLQVRKTDRCALICCWPIARSSVRNKTKS